MNTTNGMKIKYVETPAAAISIRNFVQLHVEMNDIRKNLVKMATELQHGEDANDLTQRYATWLWEHIEDMSMTLERSLDNA